MSSDTSLKRALPACDQKSPELLAQGSDASHGCSGSGVKRGKLDTGPCQPGPGPSNVHEAFLWPIRKLAMACADSDREHRLRNLLAQGVCASSDFSGMGGDREIMRLLEGVMAQRQFPLDAPWTPGCRFRHVRSCDIAPLPRRVLTYCSVAFDQRCSCVMTDLLERLPAEFRQQVDSMCPAKDDDAEICETKYDLIDSYLCMNRHEIFSESEAYCEVHEGLCSVDRWATACQQGSSSSSGSSSHKPQPLRLNSAGTVCVGWSSVGKRKRFGHSSELPHSVWLRERQYRAESDLEDMFFQECTVLYPAQTKLAIPLAASHQVLTIKTGPQAQGHPSARTPSLSVGRPHRSCTLAGAL